MLDKQEARYLERRIKYGLHKKFYSWDGMNEAIDRQERLGIISLERTTKADLTDENRYYFLFYTFNYYIQIKSVDAYDQITFDLYCMLKSGT